MKTLLTVLILLVLATIVGYTLKYRRKYASFIETHKKEVGIPLMAAYSLGMIEHFAIMEKFYRQISSIQQKMISIHGSRSASQHTRAFLAQLWTMVTLGVLLTLTIGILKPADPNSVIVIGAVSLMIPIVLIQGLTKKERERRLSIIHDLPEFLNKLILLVNAGETVQKAFVRCAKDKQAIVDDNPLYFELMEAVIKIENNMPFQEALNQLSKKCSLQEMSIFTTTLLLNYRKGGEELVRSLKELSESLWEKRKALTQIRGEEASSKMVLPLVIIFVVVMIIIGYPALAMF